MGYSVFFLCILVTISLAAKCAKVSLNIRNGPSTTFSVIERATAGDAYEIIGDERVEHGGTPWVQVASCDSSSIIGWMALHSDWQQECSCPAGLTGRGSVARNGAGGGRWPLHYDAPRSCTSGPARGATALGQVMRRHFPKIYQVGIFNCRSVRGGGSLSEHGEGRGIDLMVPVGAAGNQEIADFLVQHAGNLGIQSVIFNRRVWGYGRWNWRPYSGASPHTDHVHTGMHWDGARALTEADVEAAFSGAGRPANPPPSVNPPPNTPPTPSGRSCTDSEGNTGTCMDMNSCTGIAKAGLCPGARNIQCCIPTVATTEQQAPPPTTQQAPPPTTQQGAPSVEPTTQNVPPPPTPAGPSCRNRAGRMGTCMSVSSCSGERQRGLCAGSRDIQCCFDADSTEAPPPSAPSGPACTIANGDTGVCIDQDDCTGTRHRGFCSGGRRTQCCVGGGGAQSRSSGASTTVDNCVRAKVVVNVRSEPEGAGDVNLVAFVDEEFTALRNRGRWIEMRSQRGTGWAHSSHFEPCSAENIRSPVFIAFNRAVDGTPLLQSWEIALIAIFGAALVAIVVVGSVYFYRARQAQVWTPMEQPLLDANNSDRSSPRRSSSSVSPSPNLTKRK